MTNRTICWIPEWNEARKGIGLEHLLLGERTADSVLLAFDDAIGPFRLVYRLHWDRSWQLREADLTATTAGFSRSLHLRTDGMGNWHHGDGRPIYGLDGCLDIDIWPTPFTNSFPILREPLEIGERREFRVAWVAAPELHFRAQAQAYTRLEERRYRFDALDGSGFSVELPVDEQGIVLDYPGLFRRVI